MFWQSKTKVAEAFHTFGEEEIAELLPKIKTRQEKQVIKALHCKGDDNDFYPSTFQARPDDFVKKT